MVTKSKLKMALAAERGVDFKKLHQSKARKVARKEKAKKGGEGKGKKAEEEWEDIPEESDGEDSEDGGAVLEDDEEGSEEEYEAMKVGISAPRHPASNNGRLIWRLSMRVTAILPQARMTKNKMTKTKMTKISPCRTSKIWTKKRKKTSSHTSASL
jgi:hypothetical protein